jgi:hypothetical protein
MQRVVEEGLFDRQLDGLVMEAKAPTDDEGEKNVRRARVRVLPLRSLKSTVRGGPPGQTRAGDGRGLLHSSLQCFRFGNIMAPSLTFGKLSVIIGAGAERLREAGKKSRLGVESYPKI